MKLISLFQAPKKPQQTTMVSGTFSPQLIPTHKKHPVNQQTNKHTSHFVSPLVQPQELPEDFIPRIKNILSQTSFWPTTTPFIFEMNNDVAERNTRILQLFDFDMTKVISAFPNSHISYGFKFRPASILEPLLHNSPHWSDIKNSLSKGAKFPLERISNARRKQDNEESIKKGNHKSAQENLPILKKLVSKEVSVGFQLPIKVSTIQEIPHAVVQPYSLAKQSTFNEEGNKETKWRNAHDQSFRFSSRRSVNNRVKKEELSDRLYGHALTRIIHYLHNLRRKHPSIRILIAKHDFKSAYRRLTMWGHTAASSITIIDGIAYISLRLTFGGSPSPYLWCPIAETITDLANDLLGCKDWDPNEVRSPHSDSLPGVRRLESSTPFKEAKETDVSVSARTEIMVDDYIDDLVTITLDSPVHIPRATQAVPLAIHILSRPLSQ